MCVEKLSEFQVTLYSLFFLSLMLLQFFPDCVATEHLTLSFINSEMSVSFAIIYGRLSPTFLELRFTLHFILTFGFLKSFVNEYNFIVISLINTYFTAYLLDDPVNYQNPLPYRENTFCDNAITLNIPLTVNENTFLICDKFTTHFHLKYYINDTVQRCILFLPYRTFYVATDITDSIYQTCLYAI